jgi:L-2-hydroxyglutarate oxidase LhgO
METVECVVVGAGVIGLAIARELAIAGRETIILEKHGCVGTETSSRNSEVIHAGIHYPARSIKARCCVEGRDLLYSYCESRGIRARRCGKLVVATSRAQLPELARISHAARENGVADLQQLDARQAKALEPQLECVGALLSPSTGIVDSHAFMLSLAGDAERHGTWIAFNSPASSVQVRDATLDVRCEVDPGSCIRARWLINSAGLGAVDFAKSITGFPEDRIPHGFMVKGSYFSLAGRAPFRRLVYPVPEPGGLGVHLTLDLGGAARFGPDVEWVDVADYSVDARRADGFYSAIRSYWPALPDGALQPAYSGIRPRISAPGAPAVDFRIDGPAEHGVPGIINLFGIESPGLTASLAIARIVAGKVAGCVAARSNIDEGPRARDDHPQTRAN